MTSFPDIPPVLDDYELKDLLFEEGCTATFVALQCLIQREVLLTLVKKGCDDEAVRAFFLETAKAKARIRESKVCSVFEATSSGQYMYYTQELPPGRSLSAMRQEGCVMTPLEMAYLIREVAEVQLLFECRALPVSVWSPASVFISSKGEFRFLNPVEAGSRREDMTPRDMRAAGEFLPSLLQTGGAGTTRVQTLCSWMAGGADAPRGMNWEMVRELAETVISQLEEALSPATVLCPESAPARRRMGRRPMVWASVAVLLIIAAVFVLPFGGQKVPVEGESRGGESADRRIDPALVSLRSDVMLSLFDEQTKLTKRLSVDVHEVTIEAYERFLHFMSQLSAFQEKRFRSPGQPVSKVSYEPRDWKEMLAAARTGGVWNGQRLTMRHPVTNVDLWDAMAYARWEQRRLPSLEEWKAFAGKSSSSEKPVADVYGDVLSYRKDKASSGVCGLAGGVAEWTSTQSVNLAMPMSGKKPVVCGGSYLNHGSTETEDYMDSESACRPDLGFRTVKDL